MTKGEEACDIAAFQDGGRRRLAKECGWASVARKGKKMDCSPEPEAGMQPCWYRF